MTIVKDPDAAALEGVNVRRVRLVSNLTAGLFAGLGGSFLALGIVGAFADLFTRIGSKAAPRQLGQAWRVEVR